MSERCGRPIEARRGQAAIETTIAVLGSLVLIAGSIRICMFMVQTLVERQEAYQATRAKAARRGLTVGCLNYYQPGRLSVFGELDVPGQKNVKCQ